MGSGTRQFKALMRKNYIGWKRRSFCSVCELCCPVAMMFLMVVLRGVIDVTEAEQLDLLSERIPTYPAFFYEGNLDENDASLSSSSWSGPSKFFQTGLQLNSFMKYSAYPNATYYENPTNFYNYNADEKSPLLFLPTNCLKTNSFQLPAVEMPIIAVVGWNKATAMMYEYL